MLGKHQVPWNQETVLDINNERIMETAMFNFSFLKTGSILINKQS
jgi:hypothetical protein